MPSSVMDEVQAPNNEIQDPHLMGHLFNAVKLFEAIKVVNSWVKGDTRSVNVIKKPIKKQGCQPTGRFNPTHKVWSHTWDSEWQVWV